MEHRITGFDNYLFKAGRQYEIYEKLGAHLAEDILLYGRRMRPEFRLLVTLMAGILIKIQWIRWRDLEFMTPLFRG